MKLGPISISITRKTNPASAPLVIAGGAPQGLPFYTNRWDNPQANLALIRETVSAVMHARSEAIGKGRFGVFAYSRSGEKKRVPFDHPLEKILRMPNPSSDLSDLLELSSQWLDATGNALILKVRNGTGKPCELWLLPALGYTIEKGRDELPGDYYFQAADMRVPARDIIHIKRSDIRTAPFYGHALLSDIVQTARTETALRCYQQRYFDNDSVPRAVLKFPQGTTLTQEQMDSIRSVWEERYTGVSNANKLAILPDGGSIEAILSGAKELDFAKSHAALRDAIREAFRVPKIVLGDTDHVDLSNAETSYAVFERNVVDYALGKFARTLTRQLASEFSSEYVIEILKEENK